MFALVQFTEKDGASLSIVNQEWLTPMKTEVLWPPVKSTKAFEKILTTPANKKWQLYGVQRVLFVTDSLGKAKEKLKLAEVTSDLQTEDEENITTKRKITRKFFSSDEESNDDGHSRPPPLKKKFADLLQHTNKRKYLGVGRIPTNLTINSDAGSNSDIDDTQLIPPQKSRERSYEDKVVSLLAHIKAQNDIIISFLQNRGNTAAASTSLKPEFKFPLETIEDLEMVEKLLTVKENFANVVSYFKCLGGQGVNNKVSRVMKYALSDSLATKFNYYGKRSEKKPFGELSLRAAIIESLKTAEITEKHIENSIKSWLKHAPERVQKRLSKEGRS